MFFHPTSAFKAYLTAQREVQAEFLAVNNTTDIHVAPCSCYKCKSTNLEDKVTSTMDYTVMEYEVVCKDCLAKVAYWAHGHYEPNPPPEYSNYF